MGIGRLVFARYISLGVSDIGKNVEVIHENCLIECGPLFGLACESGESLNNAVGDRAELLLLMEKAPEQVLNDRGIARAADEIDDRCPQYSRAD
jgi:hypothetical protein